MRGDRAGTTVGASKPVVLVLAVSLLVGGLLAIATRSSGTSGASSEKSALNSLGDPTSSTSDSVSTPSDQTLTSTTVQSGNSLNSTVASDAGIVDVAGAEPTGATACVLSVKKLGFGDSGADVTCVQSALAAAGVLSRPATGEFDAVTTDAVRAVQTQRSLFVDGAVGRETALSLGIWPDEAANVVRTPAPVAGAKDLLGYPLSSVASAGSDAPPVPPDSGTGRRLVYDRAGQRIWAIDDQGRTVRSWLVSGSRYSNETAGTHEVYSRSEMSTAWNGKAFLPKMVRWLKTKIGAIGFHGLPRHVEDNSPYQTEAELGTRLSGGCQRQADLDAAFTWDFAQIGTKVVVL